MKPNLLALVAAAIFISGGLFAQVPQAMNYQAIARSANGTILPNAHISLRFTLNQGNNPGTPLYQETQAATTNQFGLFTVAIGQGTVVSGTFSGINWATGNIYLNIELDPSGGNNFMQMGESQLLSVPYALYSGSAADGNWLSNGNNIYNANTGNVGIGTTAPLKQLHVKGTSVTPGALFELSDTVTSVSSLAGINIANSSAVTNNYALISFADAAFSSGPVSVKIGAQLTDRTNHYADFVIAGRSAAGFNEHLRVTSAGNVGIGTTTPGMLLDVTSPVDTNGNAAIRGIATGTTNNVYGVMGITTGTGYAAAGVYGLTSVANASGVFGETRSGTNTAGVYGQADSSGWALFGYNNNLDGHGIALGAYLGGSGGIAVDANAGGGSAIAVSAISNSTLGTDTTIAGYFKATGGIANYALLVPAGGGNVGIGTATPATLLDVESTSSPAFKLNDGTQAAGRVLTSDANGNASWQTPGGGIQFFATSDTNTVVSQNAYSKIPFQDVRFNSGGAYNASTNYFTAPSGGLYHFDANLRLDGASGDQAYMYLSVNGGLNAGIFSTINSTGSANLIISTGLLLNAGDSVDIEVYSFNAGDHLFTENFGNTCYFSGYKVR